ncbi:hypothetical protein GCM10010289_68800 [Streptomyces violascens]|nr:hypothetical protein GCM10010289_68800 [Streptomyces violascens]
MSAWGGAKHHPKRLWNCTLPHLDARIRARTGPYEMSTQAHATVLAVCLSEHRQQRSLGTARQTRKGNSGMVRRDGLLMVVLAALVTGCGVRRRLRRRPALPRLAR